MSNYLHKLVKCIFITAALLGCTTLQANGPKISFGGYYFNAPANPTFIGASAPDSLILLFEEDAKASFIINNYKDFETEKTPLPLFLDILYGEAKPNNEKTKNLQKELEKDKVSGKVSKTENLTTYEITYKEKTTIVIFDSARSDSWITIECKNLDASKLIKSIQSI